jgi:hypothetical protein
MAKADTVAAEQSPTGQDKPVVVGEKRQVPRAVKIGAAIAAGAALFAGGFLVAGQFGGDDEADIALDSLTTQQLVGYLNQGDAILASAQEGESTDALQAKGIELQTLAVAMEPLATQFSDEDLRAAAELLAEGYLDISIGLVTNSGQKTSEGAETLNEGREQLVEVLGSGDGAGGGQNGGNDEGGGNAGSGDGQNGSGGGESGSGN